VGRWLVIVGRGLVTVIVVVIAALGRLEDDLVAAKVCQLHIGTRRVHRGRSRRNEA